jgi:hypothetical protein
MEVCLELTRSHHLELDELTRAAEYHSGTIQRLSNASTKYITDTRRIT